MLKQTKTIKPTLGDIFYIATYFGKSIFREFRKGERA